MALFITALFGIGLSSRLGAQPMTGRYAVKSNDREKGFAHMGFPGL